VIAREATRDVLLERSVSRFFRTKVPEAAEARTCSAARATSC